MPDPGSVQFSTAAARTRPRAAQANAGPGRTPTRRLQSHIPERRVVRRGWSLTTRSRVRARCPNWELVNAKHSTNGHSIAVMGPQVGYYTPEILMEEDLHGPGIDARGAAFPGVNLYVELGHGRDYAWSATTATSDNVDTFAEVLCQDEFHYLYKGQCLAMEKLERDNSWTPNGVDKTAAGSEKLTIYRTVHGIVYARGKVGGQKVAFASARTTYFHEADSAIGFSELNEPGFVTSPQQFQQAASKINFAFNWAYVDANHIAYYLSGAYPQRAAGTSPDFPILGTGEYDWQGYDPQLHTMTAAALRSASERDRPELPRVLEQQAGAALVGGRRQVLLRLGLPHAADPQLHPAGHRRREKDGRRTARSAMDEAATQDIRMVSSCGRSSSRCSGRRPVHSCRKRSPSWKAGTSTAGTAAT